MDDLEKVIQEKAEMIVSSQQSNIVDNIIEEKVKGITDVKQAVDLYATREAMSQAQTIEKVVSEKQEELRNDAEAKRVVAETKRINEEVKKVLAEKEKQVEEYDRIIVAKQKEVEQLKAESDKSQAFFDSNKDILKYIGIREKKTLGVMKALMAPAIVVFVIVQVLLSPLTFVGLLLETLVNIIGGICGTIKNNALKICVTILVILLVCGVGFCIYYFGGKYLSQVV